MITKWTTTLSPFYEKNGYEVKRSEENVVRVRFGRTREVLLIGPKRGGGGVMFASLNLDFGVCDSFLRSKMSRLIASCRGGVLSDPAPGKQ